MDEPKKGYPGVCEDYSSELNDLRHAGYNFAEMSRFMEDVHKQRISANAISKFFARDYGFENTMALLGVVAPQESPRLEETESEDNYPRDMTEDEKTLLLEKLGYDANKYYIHGGKHWKSRAGGEFLDSYDIRLKPLEVSNESETSDDFNLPTLFAEASKQMESRKPISLPDAKTATVVVWADPQTGKVDKNGGIKDQYDRVYSIREKLADYILENKADKALFLDAGDGVEGFENTSSQMFTNGLSLMDQIDLESTYEMDYIKTLAAFHDEVEVYGIDSNHCKWRSGKGTLGLPKDDWGRFIKRQLQKAFELNPTEGTKITFSEPGDWERTMNIPVYGTGIGLAHGDQVNNIDAIPKWWAGQAHGGHAVSDSHVLITGHFHHFLMRQTGRHRDGRQKFHIGAPTLDNGSAWFEGQSGESSDPGLIVFQVNDREGFDFDSLTLLRG